MAKCLVDLHVKQDTKCITKARSACDVNNSQLDKLVESRWAGSHQLSQENAEALRAAIQATADRISNWIAGTKGSTSHMSPKTGPAFEVSMQCGIQTVARFEAKGREGFLLTT